MAKNSCRFDLGLHQSPVYDSSSTIGALLAGLAYNSSGLTAYYYRSGAASSTSMSLATMTMGTWATLGFVAVDGTNMPGLYQLGIPNAALTTGQRPLRSTSRARRTWCPWF